MSRIRKSSTFNIFGFEVKITVTRTKKNGISNTLRFPLALSVRYAVLFLFSFFAVSVFLKIDSSHKVSVYPTIKNPFSPEIYNSLTGLQKHTMKNNLGNNEKIVFNGPRNKKKISLTFDADMTPEMKLDLETGYVASYYDKGLINILTETGTKATLFLSGMWIESYRSVAEDLSSNPLFELANHTYSHPAFHGACYGLTQAHDDHKIEELTKTQGLLKEVTGIDNKLFRFPGGCYSEEDLEIVSATGQTAIQWDVAGQDGFNGDTDFIVSNVVDNVKNGSIIVLHMNGYPNEPATANALPVIISQLKYRGFEFVTVSELLEEKDDANIFARFFDEYFLTPENLALR